MTDLDWVPQSCALSTREQPLRIAEWDALFTEHLTALSHLGAQRPRLELSDCAETFDAAGDQAGEHRARIAVSPLGIGKLLPVVAHCRATGRSRGGGSAAKASTWSGSVRLTLKRGGRRQDQGGSRERHAMRRDGGVPPRCETSAHPLSQPLLQLSKFDRFAS